MSFLNSNLVDLVLYDFLTTGITKNSNRFCGSINGNYKFVSNQQKMYAIVQDKHVFLPATKIYHPKIYTPDNTWKEIKLEFILSHIKPTRCMIKDCLLVVDCEIHNRQITLVFYLDLIQNVFCDLYGK